MVYVIRDEKLVQVNSTQAGDVPVYNIRDCSIRIQNPDDTARGGNPEHPEQSAIFSQTFTHDVYVSSLSFNERNYVLIKLLLIK
jgi:hypothetical protein